VAELLALQQRFAEALLDADAASDAARWLRGDAVQLEQRLAIYRANVLAATTRALGAAYPVIRQVVGETFFDGLAHAYQRQVPSGSGDLSDHGADLAAFVTDFPHTRSLPYLPDLARLEWAVHRAYGAADAPDWNPRALAQVAPARQAAVRFHWAAGAALVDSTFPIACIWRLHQPGFDGEFRVDWSVPECALVARDGPRVTVSTLGAAEARFVASSLAGDALGVSAEQALADDAGFDLGHLLSRLTSSNSICGFTIDKE